MHNSIRHYLLLRYENLNDIVNNKEILYLSIYKENSCNREWFAFKNYSLKEYLTIICIKQYLIHFIKLIKKEFHFLCIITTLFHKTENNYK